MSASLKSSRSDRGGSEANPTCDEGALIIKGDHVFIDRDVCCLQCALCILAREIFASKVN